MNDPRLICASLLWLCGAALRAHLSAGKDGSLIVLRAAMDTVRVETVRVDDSIIAQSMTQKHRTNKQSHHSSKRSLQAAEDPPSVDGDGDELALTTKRRRASTKRDTAESGALTAARRSVRDRKAAAR